MKGFLYFLFHPIRFFQQRKRERELFYFVQQEVTSEIDKEIIESLIIKL